MRIIDVKTIKKSRKPYICAGCKKEIPSGSTYVRVFVKLFDEPLDIFFCTNCHGIYYYKEKDKVTFDSDAIIEAFDRKYYGDKQDED